MLATLNSLDREALPNAYMSGLSEDLGLIANDYRQYSPVHVLSRLSRGPHPSRIAHPEDRTSHLPAIESDLVIWCHNVFGSMQDLRRALRCSVLSELLRGQHLCRQHVCVWFVV